MKHRIIFYFEGEADVLSLVVIYKVYSSKILKNSRKYDRILQYMENFMQEAIIEGKKAYDNRDVPIGAVIVIDGKIVGRGHNKVEINNDPTAHAEIVAIKEATKNIGYSRLYDAVMYVTCEPCIMCLGASILARIKKIVIGTLDPKTGACISKYQLAENNELNHKIEIEHGILAEQCSQLLTDFFYELRKNKRRNKE